MMQDYKLVIRNVTSGATVIDQQTGNVLTQNAAEFTQYLNDVYLAQGYEVREINSLQVFKGDVNTGATPSYEFAYHLVKDTAPTVTSKSK